MRRRPRTRATPPKPPSRDPAAERKRQAKKARAAGGKKRRAGKYPGASGTTLEMTDTPDEVIDHAPEACAGCGVGLDDAEVTAVARRQVIDIPVPAPCAVGFLTIYPADVARPNVSNLNWAPGQTISDAPTVRLGTGADTGKIKVYNGSSGTTNVILDLAGFYS